MTSAYDVIVLGGGPAGAACAALTAAGGCRTLLAERERFPRFHMGESLLPETYWTLKRLGVIERLKASRFPRKTSVQFIDHAGVDVQTFSFLDADPRECSETWQVVRSEFDHLLLQNAAEKGAECREQTRAVDVQFRGSRAVSVLLQQPDGELIEEFGQVIVDATGQQSLLAGRVGPREHDPALRNAAIGAYYRGARREPGGEGGATLVLRTRDRRAWFWYVPLPDDVVSVGVVAPADYLLRGRGRPEGVFEEELVNCPAVVERLMDAQLAGELRVARDFSYQSGVTAGDGWVLVGDALGFLDPVCCSGVFLALKSGEMCADAIVEGFSRGDLSPAQLAKWRPLYDTGRGRLRKLVEAFYTERFSFGQFVRDHPRCKAGLTALLAGKVFDPVAAAVLEDLQPWLERFKEPAAPPQMAPLDATE